MSLEDSLVPDDDEVIEYQCAHCRQLVMGVPRSVFILHCCTNGQAHLNPSGYRYSGIGAKLPVTVFNSKDEPFKAWLVIEEENEIG